MPALKKTKGFTLIEILVVSVLLAIATIPLYTRIVTIQAKNALQASADRLGLTMGSAHVYSRELKDETAWGVIVEEGNSYLLVKGSPSSYEIEKRESYLRNITSPENISVWFLLGTGEAQEAKNVTLEGIKGLKVNITVNKQGVVEVGKVY